MSPATDIELSWSLAAYINSMISHMQFIPTVKNFVQKEWETCGECLSIIIWKQLLVNQEKNKNVINLKGFKVAVWCC